MEMMSWEYFRRRREIDVPKFLAQTGCTTYVEFARLLESRHIKPPLEKDVKSYFTKSATAPKVAKPTPPKSPSTPAPKKQTKTTKKRSRTTKGKAADSKNAKKSDN